MRIAMLASLLALCASACYRPAPPPQLDQVVRVEVVRNRGRLVRGQGLLQSAVAAAVRERLGWRTGPLGAARLQLTLDREDIDDVAHTDLDIPTRWSLELRGSWRLMVPGHDSLAGSFTGQGYARNRPGELAALRAAAADAGEKIAVQLEYKATALEKR